MERMEYHNLHTHLHESLEEMGKRPKTWWRRSIGRGLVLIVEDE